jgi:putative spermidine/putrescine transport system permease protein
MSRRRTLARWSARLVVGGLVAFLTFPTVVVIVASFNHTAILSFPPQAYSLRWYVNAVTYPQFQRAAVNSALVTVASAALVLPLGTAAVLALERARLRGRAVWAAALLSPLIIPGVVSGLGLLILGASLGLLQSRWLLIFAHLVLVLPFVIRSIWVSVANLDPNLERAAASLGAGPWRVFCWVTLPLLRPGLVAEWASQVPNQGSCSRTWSTTPTPPSPPCPPCSSSPPSSPCSSPTASWT